jgi:hypothetical protein
MQTQVVNVAPPREGFAARMQSARAFRADHSAPESSSAGFVQQGAVPAQHVTGASCGSWVEPARPEPVSTNFHAEPSQPQPVENGVFVAPMLSSPPQREDARAFILQHGPDGASMVQCMLQRRKHNTYELFLRDETRNLELGQVWLASPRSQPLP